MRGLVSSAGRKGLRATAGTARFSTWAVTESTTSAYGVGFAQRAPLRVFLEFPLGTSHGKEWSAVLWGDSLPYVSPKGCLRRRMEIWGDPGPPQELVPEVRWAYAQALP